jgi:hypothetical protein
MRFTHGIAILLVGLCRCNLFVFAGTAAADDAFPFALSVSRTMPENLLPNPGFEARDRAGQLPLQWVFGNFIGVSEVQAGLTTDVHGGASAASVRSEGNWPGYWIQEVPVQEGVRYYAAVYIKAMLADGTAGLRLATSQYQDEGSWMNNNSNTDVRSYAECGQGLGLEDFIDPRYLRVIRKGEWNLYDLEFIVPKGKKVTKYAFWAGLYGAGTVCVDDAYFGPAAFELKGTFGGSSLKRLRIVDQGGTAYLDQPLRQGESTHAFKVILESRLKRYSIEVTDARDARWNKPLGM